MSAMPNENGKVKVAGYVKLAKLWERSRDEAIAFHSSYYANKYSDSSQFQLVGTYIDITGKKEIRQRPEMLRLIRDCSLGKVECIDALTSGYLAANAKEFSYLTSSRIVRRTASPSSLPGRCISRTPSQRSSRK